MAYNRRDDDLAYGEYHDQDRDGAEGDRGFVGDMGRRLFGGRKEVRPLSAKRQPVIVHPAFIAHVRAGQSQRPVQSKLF
jgi:hypothetical protein